MAGNRAAAKQKASGKRGDVWTDEERAAMKEGTRERKTAARPGSAEERAEGERAIHDKIADMPAAERAIAERIHAIVTSTAPSLVPRTYYGMPAYSKDGKVLCFFKPASKFKERYSTFGFEQKANLDEGSMWATSWAITELTAGDEKRIAELVERAAG